MSDTGQTGTTAALLRRARVAAMTSPDHVVAEAVEAACSSPLTAKTRITEGFSNEVYCATTQDGQQVIVSFGIWRCCERADQVS